MIKKDIELILIEENCQIENEYFPVGDVYVTRKVFDLMEENSYMDTEYLLKDHTQYAAEYLGVEGASNWNFEERHFEGDVELVSGIMMWGYVLLWITTAPDFSKTTVCYVSELASPPNQKAYIRQ
jgi:hypothetical protein